jgi:formylglycine-generating enzyme required for sulfatase activity
VQAYETLTAAAPTSISSSDMQKTRQAEIFATVTHEAQTQTVVFGQQTQVAEATEQFILAATRTFQVAQTGVERNADWTPEIHEFDGVEMVLVPRGCFMMGSDDGEDNEQPAHEQCFDEPFWIDRYEVTQGDFARLGGERSGDSRFVGDDRPVENITWYEARNFCESRDGYLPTEKEWEYAARGPDGLVYPWGNRWGDDLTVWGGNSGGLTAMVGSRFGSASWVGAQDMGGNVGEWTSSVYRNYPYDDRTNTDFDYYVVRGGGWSSSIYSLFRASLRVRYNPLTSYVTLGFRCARS